MIQDKITKHLHFRIAGLKKQLRDQDQTIKDLEAIIKEQEKLIDDFSDVITVPKFKSGSIVSVVGMEGRFKVEHYMYDISYPIYNVSRLNNSNHIQTVPEVDIVQDND